MQLRLLRDELELTEVRWSVVLIDSRGRCVRIHNRIRRIRPPKRRLSCQKSCQRKGKHPKRDFETCILAHGQSAAKFPEFVEEAYSGFPKSPIKMSPWRFGIVMSPLLRTTKALRFWTSGGSEGFPVPLPMTKQFILIAPFRRGLWCYRSYCALPNDEASSTIGNCIHRSIATDSRPIACPPNAMVPYSMASPPTIANELSPYAFPQKATEYAPYA